MYAPRSQSLPSGFIAQTFTSNMWTDANVDYLYSYFSCCYADLAYNYIKNAKRGSYNDKEKCQQASKMSFFKTGLNTLKYWHNPSTANTAATTTVTSIVPPLASGNTLAISVYVSPNPLLATSSLSSLPLIGQVSGYTSFAAAFAALQPLLVANGFNLNVISIRFSFPSVGHDQLIVEYTAPLLYGNFTQYLVIQYVQTGSNPYTQLSTGLFSGGVDIYNPCISLKELQCLVAKMESMCGCFGCSNTAQIIADNAYVSVGQTVSSPPTPVALPTNQIPN